MNRERARELLPIIQAFAEGKALQFRAPGESWWRDEHDPVWSVGGQYRIKPEPREFWVAPFNFGNKEQYRQVEDPVNWAGSIKVREVIE